MGLLDFDKIANNAAFQLGTGILANNSGHYGAFGPALAGGLGHYSQQQELMRQQQAQRQQQEWMQKNGYGGMPTEFALAKYKADNPGANSVEFGTTVQYDNEGNSYLVGKDGSVKKLDVKLQKPVNWLNLGGYQLPTHGITGQPVGNGYQVTPKITETPKYKGDIAQAQEVAKSEAENTSLLKEMESMMPKLETTVSKLKDLASKATYTSIGKAYDWGTRELGMEVPDGAVARADFESTIDNNVLPLLRQTFGAAFTAEEGNRLRATMGDADLSPKEKLAQLESFIENKRQEVARYRSLVSGNKASGAIQLPAKPTVDNLIKGQVYSTPKGNLIWNGSVFEDM